MSDEIQKVTSWPHVHLMVCDYATVSDDGTCSIIRGGISEISSDRLPVPVVVWLYVEVDTRSMTLGDHDVVTTIVTKEEVELAEVRGILSIERPGTRARFAVPLSCSVQALGDIVVRTKVGTMFAERTILVEKKS